MDAYDPPEIPGKDPPDESTDTTPLPTEPASQQKPAANITDDTVNEEQLLALPTMPLQSTESPTNIASGLIMTNSSFSPRTPTSPSSSGEIKSPHSPQRDYKVIYREMKRRLNEQAETSHNKYAKLRAEHQKLQKKYDEEMESYKLDLNEREIHLATEHDKMKGKIREYEEQVSLKEAEILSLKETLSAATQSRDNNRADYEKMIDEHNTAINEKDDKIARLEERAANAAINSCTSLHRITSDENCYRLKPKRTSKITKTDDLKCEFEGCGKKDIDLTKCNMCNKWVCETCNDIQAAKLKPITNKCRRVYFLCKACDDNIGTENVISEQNADVTGSPNVGNNLLTSLKKMFDTKVSQMEAKIEKVIEKKLGDKMAAVNSLNEKIKDKDEVAVIPSSEKSTYSQILSVPKEIRKIMQETRNDEKVEKVEQERRSQNFIIHGAEEIGDTSDEIKENDAQYINDILTKLRVETETESITRIGKANDSKSRVLKIVMTSTAAKEKVMGNLRRLKDTEDQFGKISITDDYTSTEREKIKEFAERAREQGKTDPTRVFKVRGDPKNGLRIISFVKK
ncbi:MAG: hypothetical protein MK195_09375 [Acidimicrobiales bacterium]|nr:hypothetical protein [Acidimicrobiales bacterium]